MEIENNKSAELNNPLLIENNSPEKIPVEQENKQTNENPEKPLENENTQLIEPKINKINENQENMTQPKKTSPKPAIKTQQSKKLCLDDFDYIRNLGKGSFGEVVLVKKKSDEKLYAMKAIDKNFLKKVVLHY